MTDVLLWLILTHPGSEHDRANAERLLQVDPDRVELQVERAIAHWRLGQVSEATTIVNYHRVHESWPLEGLWLEGMLALDQRNFSHAEERLRRYREGGGTRASALSALAEAVKGQGRWRESGQLYAEALEVTQDPDDAIHAARMAALAGQHHLAIERINRAIGTLGPAVSLRVVRVEILEGAGKVDKAAEELGELLKLAPNHTAWRHHHLELTQRLSERKP